VSTTGQWDELFGGGRKWRVAEEVSGTQLSRGDRDGAVVRDIPVTFTRGRFELPEGAAYQSLLSTNRGRRGVLLVETSPDGSSDVPGSRIAVGEAALLKAREQYAAVW
jgi:hypothetical protein